MEQEGDGDDVIEEGIIPPPAPPPLPSTPAPSSSQPTPVHPTPSGWTIQSLRARAGELLAGTVDLDLSHLSKPRAPSACSKRNAEEDLEEPDSKKPKKSS